MTLEKLDKRVNNGGSRIGAGAKRKNPEEKKVTIPFQIKRKHIEKAKKLLKPLVDEINLS